MTNRTALITSSLLATTILASTAALAQQQGSSPRPEGEPPLEEIVVRGAYIPEPKRESSQVAAFLTRDDFTRTGDDDVAGALARSTGITLNRGKFVFVRGLGERFSSVVLNGLSLPSPEPLRRVAPLDVFPTEVLEGVTVQKTYSPQYSGDFGGGLIDLRTRKTPDESFFSLYAEVGVDTQASFRDAVLSEGGEFDFLGINGKIRDIPAPLKEAFASGKRINRSNFTAEELQTIGRSIPNSELSVLFEGNAPVETEFNASLSRPFELFGARAGLFLNANFTSDWQTRRGKRQVGIPTGTNVDDRGIAIFDDFDLFGTQNDTRWSGLATLGFDWADHSLKFTELYIKSTTKENRILTGIDGNVGQNVRRDFIEWFDREMFTSQVNGEHYLFGNMLELRWAFGYSDASRDAPFERRFGFVENADGELQFDINGFNNLTRFSTIEDEVFSGNVEARLNYDFGAALNGYVYAGYSRSDTERNAVSRDLRFRSTSAVPRELLFSRIDFIFAGQNINPGRFEIEESSSLFDTAYNGSLDINAAFFGVKTNLGAYVTVDAGLHIEDGEQIVDTFSLFAPNTLIETQIEGTDFLPAVSVNYTFAENMQLRAAWSQTIGRPQFRELAFSEFQNVETDQDFFGNPFLINPSLENFDLRYEWYFARNQFLTLGLFYKTIDDPIEELVFSLGGGDTVQTTFQNAPKARLKGFEFEVERRFALTESFGGDFFANKEFLVAVNYTLTDSNLVIKEGDTIIRGTNPTNPVILPAPLDQNGRRLQGQATHILNVQLGFEDLSTQSQFVILYNYTSKRIRELGLGVLPSVFARDPASLDIRYQKAFGMFGRDWRLSLTARNLLGDDFRAVQGSGENRIIVDGFEVGRSISVGLQATF
ncbi:MAG: TonB-dependent receptor [Rhodothalassiaceae bacterium]